MEHNFTHTGYSVGVEEELMILDGETLDLVNAIEELLGPAERGDVKPELMESVLEISTDPCANAVDIEAKMRALRRIGVPYTDEQIATARDQVKGKTEADALIAYLQGLGTSLKGAR